MYILYRGLAAAGGAPRRRGGGLVAAALLRRLSLAGHQLPVDDRVRLAPAFEPRSPDGRVDGVRGGLLRVEEADVALLAGRVLTLRALSSLTVQST